MDKGVEQFEASASGRPVLIPNHACAAKNGTHEGRMKALSGNRITFDDVTIRIIRLRQQFEIAIGARADANMDSRDAAAIRLCPGTSIKAAVG